jgi:hypothetical protein
VQDVFTLLVSVTIPEAYMHTLKPYVSCAHMAIEISSDEKLLV